MAPGVGKLKRMKARLNGTAGTEIPALYSIRCDCGSDIEGTRNPTSTQTCCPDCLTELYLLPTNVYPSTDSVPSDVISGGFAHRLTVVASEMLPKRRTSRTSAARTALKSAKKKKKSAKAGSENHAETTRPKLRLNLPRFSPVRTVRRLFSPLRLLVMGMLLTIIGTLGILWNQNRMEIARTTWRVSTDLIPKLLDQGEFTELNLALVEAVDAGRLLGEDGPEWRHTVNLLEETKAIATVALSTLPATLSEAGFNQQTPSGDEEVLKALLTQGTFVVDGYIDPANSKHKFIFDIPVMPGQRNVAVSLELAELQEFLAKSPSHRSVFAFRVSDVQNILSFATNVCIIEVDPQSFVLFTSAKHCEQLGWAVKGDPELSQLLKQQRDFVEGSAQWTQRHQRITEEQMAGAGE